MKKSVLFMMAVLLALTLLIVACHGNKDPQTPIGSADDTSNVTVNSTDEDTSTPDTEQHVHAYGEWTIITDATCTAQGKKQCACDCGDNLTEILPMLAHNFVDGTCDMCKAVVSVGLTYELNSEGSGYIVTGTGTCSDTELVFPATYESLPVVEIGYEAFAYCTSLTSVIIPNSVKSIGDYAFYSCTSLLSITISDSVTSIGNRSFYECRSLVNIIIPNSVTSIGSGAFLQCTGLTSIIIPDRITSIGGQTFRHCTNLTNIIIPDSVTDIGFKAFENCSILTNVYYTGTAEEWAAITINSEGNSSLTNATIHYNWTGE